MARDATFRENEQYIEVSFPAHEKVDDVKGYMEELTQYCAGRKTGRVLVDVSALPRRGSVIDIFDLARHWVDMQRTNPLKIAVVVDPGSVQPGRFFETVARNRGAVIQGFTGKDEAARWLMEGRAVKRRTE